MHSSISKKRKMRIQRGNTRSGNRGNRIFSMNAPRKTRKRAARDRVGARSGQGKVRLDRFPNGLSFIYEPSINQALELSCICLFINRGSAQEPEDLRGVSHLIEHMMFKATKNRSQNSLLKIFDSTGAKFNAYTNKRLTCFYIICETRYMETCMDALSEMITHAIFDKKQFEKEQKIVREENVQDEDDPDSLLYDGIDMALFDGTSYSAPIDYIHSPLDRKKVIDYYRQNYVPGNMALSIVSSASYGAVENIVAKSLLARFHSLHPSSSSPSSKLEDEIKGEAENKADEIDISHLKYHPYVKYERHRSKNGMEIVYGDLKGFNTVQIAIGFRTCAWNNVRDRIILKLIRRIFSRGLNGRMYSELREKYGLAYSPSAGVENNDKVGKISLYTEIEASKLIAFSENGHRKKGVLPILCGMIREIITNGPTAKEWEDVKGYCHGEEMIFMEKISHLAEYNGKNYWLSIDGMEDCSQKGAIELFSYHSHWEKYIQTITLEDCRTCIAKYFKPSSMCIVLIGHPLPSIQSLEKCVGSYFK